MSPGELFLPRAGMVLCEPEVLSWFDNIFVELRKSYLEREHNEAMDAYYRDAGLLNRRKVHFFRAHFGRPLTIALCHLFGAKKKPRILDLGCGMGTQSLLFALLGAEVVGVDLDQKALRILEARKGFYERRTGRPLDIRTIRADTFALDYTAYGPFDGMWSLFAFNMMQPSALLLDRMLPSTASGCRFAVMDGNRLHWAKRFRKPAFSPIPSLAPPEFAREMEKRCFRVTAQHSGIGFPPILWRFLSFRVLRALEERLDGKWRFPISYLTLAEKGNDVA